MGEFYLCVNLSQLHGGAKLNFSFTFVSVPLTQQRVPAMEKAFVAQRVANKLFATEEAVDAAMVEATELMTEMLKARKDVGVSTVFGDEAAAKLVEAIKALGEARTAMVGVHGELNEAKLRLGIRTKLFGPDKPQEPVRSAPAMRDVG
ncbi:hypothetical protein [Phenylobacterium sp.]|uniref:hypothetical protein n=2 Tax=Phenylobacterium sp. TaxID=1871053 RepID=UPI0035C7C621